MSYDPYSPWGEPEPLTVLTTPMHWCDLCARYITDQAGHDMKDCNRAKQ